MSSASSTSVFEIKESEILRYWEPLSELVYTVKARPLFRERFSGGE